MIILTNVRDVVEDESEWNGIVEKEQEKVTETETKEDATANSIPSN